MKIGVVNAFSLPHIFRAPSTFHLCVNNRLNLFLQEGRRGGGGGRTEGGEHCLPLALGQIVFLPNLRLALPSPGRCWQGKWLISQL